MLEGLIQSYIEAFGRGWAPRDELAYVVHESRHKRPPSGLNVAIDTGSGYAKRAVRDQNQSKASGGPWLQPV